MGNKHLSLSKKIVFMIAFILLTLNIALYVTIIGLNKSTLYEMEKEKAQLIVKTYAPLLAMQIYLGMDKKIETIVDQIMINEYALSVSVLFGDEIFYKSKDDEYREGIEASTDILEPGSTQKIATLKLVYSKKNYEAVLSRNLKIISLFLLAFIIVFIGFSWYIQRQLNPLHTLASILETYTPDSDITFPHSEKNDEIGLIAKALTNMHERIQVERKKSRKNEQLLIQQSRQAAMGEMIGNIAHQWRQPLNSLGLVLQNIYFTYQMDDLNDEFMQKSVDKGKMLTSSMSKTIDDFRDFFKPNKLKEKFYISDIIHSSIELIDASYKNYNITLETNLDQDAIIHGYPGEFSQVILNILSNAKDALIDNKEENRIISISTHKNDDDVIIEIKDNAGGIPQEIITKIFDPYFTTKEEGKGTGIGLYMTKTIIENNMAGKISVENLSEGACFSITLQREKENIS